MQSMGSGDARSCCGYGYVKASSGAEAKGFEVEKSDNSKSYYGGTGSSAQARQNIISNDDPVDSYISKMNKYNDGVNAAENSYWPEGKNSNSYTAGGVEILTGKKFQPQAGKSLPGVDAKLNVSSRSCPAFIGC